MIFWILVFVALLLFAPAILVYGATGGVLLLAFATGFFLSLAVLGEQFPEFGAANWVLASMFGLATANSARRWLLRSMARLLKVWPQKYTA